MNEESIIMNILNVEGGPTLSYYQKLAMCRRLILELKIPELHTRLEDLSETSNKLLGTFCVRDYESDEDPPPDMKYDIPPPNGPLLEYESPPDPIRTTSKST